MKYTVVILLEPQETGEDSISFIKELHGFFATRQIPFELLVVVNGIGDSLRRHMKELLCTYDRLMAIEFSTPTTNATCVKAALDASNGDVMVLCGSYRQISSDSLAQILEELNAETDVIVPWRRQRVDTLLNQLESKVFNALIRLLSGSDFHDVSCTVKVFRREVLKEIDIYGNMYRFLPILAQRKGFKVKEVKCEHLQQKGKSGIYGFGHYFNTFIDILTIWFKTRFTRKPLRFFSTIGLIFLLAGVLINFYVFGERLLFGRPVGGRLLLLGGVFSMVMGVQVASVGLLGEIIAFAHGRHRKEYTVDKII